MANVPAPRDDTWLGYELGQIKRRLDALERPETSVVVDPSLTVGDPAHGHAIFVYGNLTPILGSSGGHPQYGAASFKTGSWVIL